MKSRLIFQAILLVAALFLTPTVAVAERVQGSGSTFAYPVIKAWAKGFLEFRADGGDFVLDDLGVDYEPVGSLAGIMRLAQPEIDFAASDAPLPPGELAKRGLAQFPVVIGGLAAVYNLDGVEPGALKLTGDALAQIYLGKIAHWNDPVLVGLNPGLDMPDVPITVVHRSDGSGSTLTWTRYLSASSPDWSGGPGSDRLLEWPTGVGVEGTSRMIEAVRSTSGAIGYVEYGQAVREGLKFAQVSNGQGRFVTASADIFARTAALANWDPAQGFHLQLADVQSAEAYPLAAATFVLMHREQRSAARTRRTLHFMKFALERGAGVAESLGYVPLPAALVEQVKGYWRDALPGSPKF